MAPDINVLVAASRTDHVHHKVGLAWLHGAVARCNTGGTIEILPMVASGFLRLTTHSRVFVDPTPTDAALAFMSSLLAVPGVDMPELGREWPALKALATHDELTGNAILDAWIATVVKTLGVHLVTFDGGFSRWLSRAELTVLDLRTKT